MHDLEAAYTTNLLKTDQKLYNTADWISTSKQTPFKLEARRSGNFVSSSSKTLTTIRDR
jgi:hypothetical protein